MTSVTQRAIAQSWRPDLAFAAQGVFVKVTFYGVRGSTPCHGDDTRRYGGNTSCVAVSAPGDDPLFFDIGTGARYLGAAQPVDRPFRGTCLLSHLHWDHAQGLPFFSPLLRQGSHLDLYAPKQDDGRTLVQTFDDMIRPPMFPVRLEQFPGRVQFHELEDADFGIGGFSVRSRLVPHLGPTLGYRVERDGRSVAYLSDHQQPHDGSFSVTGGARELVQGVDLLIHDAQYTTAEFGGRCHWGHSTIDYAIWLARECSVGALALFHHDPTRDDDALDAIAACSSRHGVEVVVAREGLTLDLVGG
jgi:phosphoribosyl 1,2-cyclic phosphodiesterase